MATAADSCESLSEAWCPGDLARLSASKRLLIPSGLHCPLPSPKAHQPSALQYVVFGTAGIDVAKSLRRLHGDVRYLIRSAVMIVTINDINQVHHQSLLRPLIRGAAADKEAAQTLPASQRAASPPRAMSGWPQWPCVPTVPAAHTINLPVAKCEATNVQ